MDERRARIRDDLRDLIDGEILFRPIERAPYALDASLYEIDPLGVVVPRHEGDVHQIIRYAAERGIPIHPRGAGTSMAGETLGEGLVVDFSRHFRRIVATRAESVVVQPGVVLGVLNAHLAPLGRRIGPDPSGPETRTIGGMIGADSSGARSLRYGTMGDHVESLKAVLSTGDVVDLGWGPWPNFARDPDPDDRTATLERKVASILRLNADAIARGWPRSPRNRAGYHLPGSSEDKGLDLARMVVGSEGTLAIVTEATVRTVPIPPAQAAVVLPFRRLADAMGAVAEILEFGPTACELIDWRSISLARDAVGATVDWFPEPAEAALIVEFEGDDADGLAGSIAGLVRRVDRLGRLAGEPTRALRRAEAAAMVGLRSVVRPLLGRIKGPAWPVAFIEDIAVPPETLPPFMEALQRILKRFEVPWTVYGHVGHGQLHVRPFLNLADPADRAKLEPIATEVYEAAWRVGGTISGEHGCGLVRTRFLRRQYGDLVHAFRAIKEAFDPTGLFNPGKVVGDENRPMTESLRSIPAPAPSVSSDPGTTPVESRSPIALPVIQPALRWGDNSPAAESAACNGCGACRTLLPSLRMCPTFRALRTEAASPRAQANLLRQVSTGVIDPRLWGSEELKAYSDLCIHCNLCKLECPSAVDVSSLMIEAKAAFVENHGLAPIDRTLSRLETWSRIASRFPIVSNALMRSRGARWLVERLFGLSRLRRLPKVGRTPFVRRAAGLGLTRPRAQESGPRVAYFVDIFANYFDHDLARAAVGVLRHAGVNVFIPPRQRGSGMAALVAGDLDHARELATTNLRALGDAVRDGYTVVCSEPSAVLMLRFEYLKLTENLDAGLVAANTMDLGQYLAGLAARGQLPEPTVPLRARVGYHLPCHLKAQSVGQPGMDLLATIPELDVTPIDRGCSGMAGTFGLARKNFRTSLRAGRGLHARLREDDIEIGATECGSCRLQMEQGSVKRTYHPIKLLGLGYGLDPSLLGRFREGKRRHEIA